MITDAGVVPRVRARENLRIPDIAVTCAPPGRGRTLAEPVLLIEILSPSNAQETWANVWSYTTIPSVAEISVISSTEIGADLLRRLPDGAWPEQPQALGAGAALELRAIGLSLTLDAAYRTAAVG